MSDHEFEKQVRQKLNNLKITPSPEAWENIEERLRARRRRLPLLWLPLLLAGIAAGGYFFSENAKDQPAKTVASLQATKPSPENHSSDKSNTLPLNHKTATPATDLHPGGLPDNAGASLPSKNRAHSPVAMDDGEQRSGANVKRHVKDAAGTGIPEKLARHDAGKNTSGIATTDDIKKVQQAAGLSGQTPPASDEADQQKTSVVPGQQPAQPEERQIDSSQKEMSHSGPVSQNTTPAAVAAHVAKRADSKWSYAVTLLTGASAISKNGLGLEKSTLAMAAYPQSSFAAVVVNYAPVYRPSITSPGLTFSAGVEVKRELSARFSLSAGLEYTQMNTHVKAGQQMNSNFTNYGLRGYLLSNAAVIQNETKEFTNKFHFIEIPVSLHTRLNKSTKLPVYWDAGFVVSRLLSSTSARFNENTGIYYHDDSLARRTQAGLMTGFSFVLFNKTARPLWIGPSIRTNISSVLKDDPSDNRHFMTLGLDLRWFLKR